MPSTSQETSNLGIPPNTLDPSGTDLTERERVVLAAIVTGLSNKEIGLSLAISSRTVEFHRANLLKKYGARNTADLVRRVLTNEFNGVCTENLDPNVVVVKSAKDCV